MINSNAETVQNKKIPLKHVFVSRRFFERITTSYTTYTEQIQIKVELGCMKGINTYHYILVDNRAQSGRW